MKISKNVIKFTIILLLLTSLNACKKNKNESGNSGRSGTYTYLGNKLYTTKGDYLLVNGDTYLFVYGDGLANIVQLIFSGSAAITPGTFTYKAYGAGYNAGNNFSGGSLTTDAHPEGTAITGGTVTVAKTEAGFSVVFDCTTAAGSAKGSYSGVFTSR